MATAMTTRDPGTRGANRRNTSSKASRPALSSTVVPLASPSSCATSWRMRKKSSAETEIPSSFGSWLAMIVSAMPFT